MSANPYDPIARVYDPWSASVTEDVEFYVEEALASGGPVVELACGTGRIAVPIAKAGIRVIGVDASAGMLEVARGYAFAEGVEDMVELRQGDMREPPARKQQLVRRGQGAEPVRLGRHVQERAERNQDKWDSLLNRRLPHVAQPQVD